MNHYSGYARIACIIQCLLMCGVALVSPPLTGEAAIRVFAWGAGTTNSGIYPDLGQSIVPSNLTNAIAIASGETYSMALKADGTIAAWGDDSSGQVSGCAGLTNVVAIAAG